MKKIKIETECYSGWEINCYNSKCVVLKPMFFSDSRFFRKNECIIESGSFQFYYNCSYKIFGIIANKKIEERYEKN